MNSLENVITAIGLIEDCLTEKIDLDIIADNLHYSKYHLHHIFTDTVGLTIHDYIRRRKLTEAAKLLVFSEKSILEIALLAGYESQQAFGRVFKAMYKQPPLEFRRNEVFYPLQLEYKFGNHPDLNPKKQDTGRELRFADGNDISLWMDLVRLVIDGFPNLIEEEHIRALRQSIAERSALIMTEGGLAIGIMLISYTDGSINFLGVHPLYRKQGIARALLKKALAELLEHKNITITTFREGDKADTGYRKALKELGFAEAELLTEFGYPTQKMIFSNKEKEKKAADADMKFPEEAEHLERIKRKLNLELASCEEAVEKHDRDYMDSKRYLAEYRHEIDPTEIFQNELAMKQIESAGVIAVQRRERIVRMLDSPYFARIDFCAEEELSASAFYIGSFSYLDKDTSEIVIFDWRAPVSGMFYDCEPGRAGYEAPMGRVNGELTRKRQFKISQGQMEYVLESAVNIGDEVLQRELSHTSDEKMKTIIATIQREQNQIIRNEQADILIIQGAAGSGKTSIALHRIAYLLYRYKESLSARNVVILSPNKVFADYISNVLPELGEEPIFEMSFADIAGIQLEGIMRFEADRDPLETNDSAWVERVRFKSGIDFLDRMDRYLKQAAVSYFEAADLEFGRFKAGREWILARYHAYRSLPVKRRLQEIAGDIYERFRTENVRDDELPREKVIYKKLLDMFKIRNTLALYKDFYRAMGIPEKFIMPDRKTLEWADVYPFLYFHATYEGLKGNRLIRQLVIDEMQDYTPVQYAVMNKLFNCKKTILGDFGQSLNPNYSHTLEDFGRIYKGAEVVELNKSYRSTYEIITFAKKIQKSALEPVERHGDAPEIICCGDSWEELVKTGEKIKAFKAGGNATLGIITKTNAKAKALCQSLSEDFTMQLLTPDSRQFLKGVTVTSVQMSKGLEFDEVIILSADDETYHTDFDRKLLYIACTRAMHKLSLLYTGKLTGLIEE